MSDNIEYNGNWAQPEVIEELKNQGVIASNSTGAEAVAISNTIGAFARSYAGNIGLTEGINQRTVRISSFQRGNAY